MSRPAQATIDRLRRVAAAYEVLADEMAATIPSLQGIKAPADTAKSILKLRRRRDVLFGSALFGEPAWDMLLDLLVAEDERREISVSSLCIAAAVPPTTALRWITTLEEQQLIVRRRYPHDRRGIYISLTPEASAKLRALLLQT